MRDSTACFQCKFEGKTRLAQRWTHRTGNVGGARARNSSALWSAGSQVALSFLKPLQDMRLSCSKFMRLGCIAMSFHGLLSAGFGLCPCKAIKPQSCHNNADPKPLASSSTKYISPPSSPRYKVEDIDLTCQTTPLRSRIWWPPNLGIAATKFGRRGFTQKLLFTLIPNRCCEPCHVRLNARQSC